MSAHFVYVVLDVDRQPLYVGCTNDVERRLREHKGYGLWHDRAAYILTTEFEAQDEALAAERERIESLRPLFNRRHNPRFALVTVAMDRNDWIVEYYRLNGWAA